MAAYISTLPKNTMKLSGIDINTSTAHSNRHASTSIAYKRGVDIDTIRRTAGWSKDSLTFAKFYNKPNPECKLR